MTIATTQDTTRIFIDRAALEKVMTITDFHSRFQESHFNTEVFRMAGQVGVDCLTIELFEVAAFLKDLKII